MAKCPICNSDKRSWSLKAIVKRPTYHEGHTDLLPIQLSFTDKSPGDYSEVTKLKLSAGIIIGVFLVIFGFYAYFGMSSDKQYADDAVTSLLLCSLPGFLLFLFTAYTLFFNFERYKENDEKRYEKKAERYNRRASKWLRSYYCEMDDIIYDSETGDYCDPSEFQKYLER